MKVLRVISSMNPSHGGPSQGIRNSIPELCALGVESDVVSLDSPNAEFLDKDTFRIFPVGQESGPWKYHKALFPWLLKNLGNYDIVIVHGLWLYHSFAVYKAIKKIKREHPAENSPKMYIMPHGMLDPYFQKSAGRKLKSLRNLIYWHLVERKVVNESDGVLFTCEEELRLARYSFASYEPKREINVGYGIKAPPPYEDRMREKFISVSGISTAQPFVLFLSRIHQKKGLDLLIKGYLRLKSEGKLLPKLVIAGPGIESKYGAYIKHLASSSEDIHFVGMLRGDSKWGAFYGCEAFILPSHQENFGIAIVEAMACGKPVLISEQVNIWREIDGGKAGIIKPDTLQGTHDLLLHWHSLTVNEKVQMGKNAERVYHNYFSIEKAAQKMKEALNI